MLLYIYLGTTAFVWADTLIHQIYLDRRLKKDGYVFTKKNFLGFGDVLIGSLFLVTLSIPVFNLVFPLSHLNKDRSYDEYVNYLDEAGMIEKKDELENNKSTKEVIGGHIPADELYKAKTIKIDDSVLYERTNQNGHTYYSSMEKSFRNMMLQEETKDEEKHKVLIKK